MKYILMIFVLSFFVACNQNINHNSGENQNITLSRENDSLQDIIDHSIVIPVEDVQTHFGTFAFGPEKCSKNSTYYLSTGLSLVHLPQNVQVKWKINQENVKVDKTDDYFKNIEVNNLNVGKHKFSGKYIIYCNDKKISEFPWEREVVISE